jgi:L-ascorbate metabolism protein UlaG (beta-lactamase superfamily)
VRTQARALLALALLAACTTLPVPVRSVFHPADAALSITRVAHGGVILEMRGTRVVVDPWFHSDLLHRQTEPLGLTPEGLPELQAVLLTHLHADHFDTRALRTLAVRVPEVLARPELGERLTALGFRRVTPLGWWDTAQVGAITVTAVPAHHAVPENGYVLEADGVRAYDAGDTRPFAALVDVATRFPALDVALLPVGGERLFGLFPREMGPREAAEAAALLAPKRVIPIGYGESGAPPLRWHANDPVERFRAECAKRGLSAGQLVVLSPGESWHYYR